VTIEKAAFMKRLFRNKEVVGGLIFFAISIYLLYEISTFPTTAERYRSLGPEVFPNVISGALLVLSIMLFVQGWLKEESPILSFKLFSAGSLRMFSIIALLLVFMLVIQSIGFIVWGLAFMVLVQVILGERRVAMIALLSVVVVAVVYVVFATLLGVPLPKPDIFS
jgi:hypothetical protein